MAVDDTTALELLKKVFGLTVIKHSLLLNKSVKTVALCGGAGGFMIKEAIQRGADIYITSDLKYHQFYDAENQMLIADIGHYESENCTIELLFESLHAKFPTFAIQKTTILTNPVHYYM